MDYTHNHQATSFATDDLSSPSEASVGNSAMIFQALAPPPQEDSASEEMSWEWLGEPRGNLFAVACP